jgi:hypothetical protein
MSDSEPVATISKLRPRFTRNVQGTQLVRPLDFWMVWHLKMYLEWQYPGNWSWARRPCIVDGITLTTTGMPHVIGHPPLAHQLFQLGYKQHLGFTYWERNNNDLTDTLFAEFGKGQITRVSEFAQVLDQLADSEFDSPTYVQIVRSGLDQFVHRYRERPISAVFRGEYATERSTKMDHHCTSARSLLL